jgi:hypothetical protein
VSKQDFEPVSYTLINDQISSARNNWFQEDVKKKTMGNIGM